jgi:hypothetical protein
LYFGGFANATNGVHVQAHCAGVMMTNICMIDSGGRRVAVPLVRMQSEAGLREIMIANPARTAECWAEMQRRRKRKVSTARLIEINAGRIADLGYFPASPD